MNIILKILIGVVVFIVLLIIILICCYTYMGYEYPPPIFSAEMYPNTMCYDIATILNAIYIGFVEYEESFDIKTGTFISSYVEAHPESKVYKQLINNILSKPADICALFIKPSIKYLKYYYPQYVNTGEIIRADIYNERMQLDAEAIAGDLNTQIAELEACKQQAIYQIDAIMASGQTAANDMEIATLAPKIKNFYAQLLDCLYAYNPESWSYAYNRFYDANKLYRPKSTRKSIVRTYRGKSTKTKH